MKVILMKDAVAVVAKQIPHRAEWADRDLYRLAHPMRKYALQTPRGLAYPYDLFEAYLNYQKAKEQYRKVCEYYEDQKR